MEKELSRPQVSAHLKVGVGSLAVGGCYVVMVLLFGWSPIPCLVWALSLLSLMFGGVAVVCGLFLRDNRRGSRPWKHVGVLLAIAGLLCSSHYFLLLDLRARLFVALTGGRDELQAWAVALLDSPRDPNDFDDRVPEERWSPQVRRLRPKAVDIQSVFENGTDGVRLAYGSGFFHWWIVIGRPGSRPDPRHNDPNGFDYWLRWGDGVYDWQQG
ncbi:MAG: hypothetical protein KBE65_19975 [Phycisphaerae bacterium]|nr:hypothetical protein [Phycisphaerae bacterium]